MTWHSFYSALQYASLVITHKTNKNKHQETLYCHVFTCNRCWWKPKKSSAWACPKLCVKIFRANEFRAINFRATYFRAIEFRATNFLATDSVQLHIFHNTYHTASLQLSSNQLSTSGRIYLMKVLFLTNYSQKIWEILLILKEKYCRKTVSLCLHHYWR